MSVLATTDPSALPDRVLRDDPPEGAVGEAQREQLLEPRIGNAALVRDRCQKRKQEPRPALPGAMQTLRGHLDPAQARAPPAHVGQGAAHDQRIGADRTEVDEGAGQPSAGDAINGDEIGGVEGVHVVGDGAVPVTPPMSAGHADLTHVTHLEAIQAVEPRRGPMGGDCVSTGGQGGRHHALMPTARGTGDEVHAGVALLDPAPCERHGKASSIEVEVGSLAT